MPRKTRALARRWSAARARFNEAAARCRGKRRGGGQPGHAAHASMRPRPDAAENSGRRSAATVRDRASMRPRPDAAENERSLLLASPAMIASFNEAAARCRGKHTVI